MHLQGLCDHMMIDVDYPRLHHKRDDNSRRPRYYWRCPPTLTETTLTALTTLTLPSPHCRHHSVDDDDDNGDTVTATTRLAG